MFILIFVLFETGVKVPLRTMVVLGFRPRVEAAAKPAVKDVKPAVKDEKPAVKDVKQLVKDVKSGYTKKQAAELKTYGKPAALTVSSNWKRLKSLNHLTTKTPSPGANVKGVSDAEWFGVKDVAEFAAGSEDQILRENVSTASLFPPPPSGISAEKLKQPCKFVALDCEMVGTGLKGFESILARVSVVNFHGIELMDVYVKAGRRVVDYRTAVSGVTAGHLTASREDPTVNIYGQPLLDLSELQSRLIPLLEGRIVVGHALNNDFAALLLSSNHPRRLIRDTSRYAPFRALSGGRSPSLKMLAARILGVRIQGREHDSVDDARVAMLLYRSVKAQWENAIFTRTTSTDKADSKTKRRRGSGSGDEAGMENIYDPNLPPQSE